MNLKGASAILHSSLTNFGWKFPQIDLNDTDERLLVEIEIKLKLHLPKTFYLLQDILSDYPAEVLIQRVGVISALFDRIGSKLTVSDSDTQTQLECLQYLLNLFGKCISAFNAYIDGNICSSQPSFMTGNHHSTSPEHNLQSLSQQHFPLKYKDTLKSENCTNDAKLRIYEKVVHENVAKLSVAHKIHAHRLQNQLVNSTAPVPSLAGLAFALCAVTLPLIKQKQVRTAASVLQTYKALICYVWEPLDFQQLQTSHISNVYDQATNPQAPEICSEKYLYSDFQRENHFKRAPSMAETPFVSAITSTATQVNVERMQHVLDRVEQLIVEFGGSDYIHSLILGSSNTNDIPGRISINRMATADSPVQDEQQQQIHLFNLTFVQIVLEVIVACPEDYLQCNSSDSSVDANRGDSNSVWIHKHTKQLLIFAYLIIIDSENNNSVYAKYSHIVDMVHKLDPVLEVELTNIRGIMHSLMTLSSIKDDIQNNGAPAHNADVNVKVTKSQDLLITYCSHVAQVVFLFKELLPVDSEGPYPISGDKVYLIKYLSKCLESLKLSEFLPYTLFASCNNAEMTNNDDIQRSDDKCVRLNREVDISLKSILFVITHLDTTDVTAQLNICCGMLTLLTSFSDTDVYRTSSIHNKQNKELLSVLVHAYYKYHSENQDTSTRTVEELIAKCALTDDKIFFLRSTLVKHSGQHDLGIETFLHCLAQPFVIHTLIHGVLFKVQSTNTTHQYQLKCVVVCILETLASFVVTTNRVNEETLADWVDILYTMKVLIWSYSDRVIVNKLFPRNFIHLIPKIEELVTLSQNSKYITIVNQVNLLGMFHSSEVVRKLSFQALSVQTDTDIYAYAYNEFKSKKISDGNDDHNIYDAADARSVFHHCDIVNNMPLRNLWSSQPYRGREQASQVEDTTASESNFVSNSITNFEQLKQTVDYSSLFTRSYTHKDLQKLISLGLDSCGNDSNKFYSYEHIVKSDISEVSEYIQMSHRSSDSDCSQTSQAVNSSDRSSDYKTQAAAISQARILLSDQHIMTSCGEIWCQQLIIKCLQIINSMTIAYSNAASKYTTNSTASQTQPISLDELKYFNEILSLFKLVFISQPHLHPCFVFDQTIHYIASYKIKSTTIATNTINSSLDLHDLNNKDSQYSIQRTREIESFNIRIIYELMVLSHHLLESKPEITGLDTSGVQVADVLWREVLNTAAQIIFFYCADSRHFSSSSLCRSECRSSAEEIIEIKYESEIVSKTKQNFMNKTCIISIPHFILTSGLYHSPISETLYDVNHKKQLATFSDDCIRVDIVSGKAVITVFNIHTVPITNPTLFLNSFRIAESTPHTDSRIQQHVSALITRMALATSHKHFVESAANASNAIICYPITRGLSSVVNMLEQQFWVPLIRAIEIIPKSKQDFEVITASMNFLMTFFQQYITNHSVTSDTQVTNKMDICVANIFNALLVTHFSILTFNTLQEELMQEQYESEHIQQQLILQTNQSTSGVVYYKLQTQYVMLQLLFCLLEKDFWKNNEAQSFLIKVQSIVYELSFVINNKYYPSCIRNTSCDIIYRILEIHSPQDALLIMSMNHNDDARSRHFYNLSVKPNLRPLDHIYMNSKLLRYTDSFHYSAVVMKCLAIVCQVLQYEYHVMSKSECWGKDKQNYNSLFDHHTIANQSIHNSRSRNEISSTDRDKSDCNRVGTWSFLVRLCFDLRNNIKVQALECIRLLLCIYPNLNISVNESSDSSNNLLEEIDINMIDKDHRTSETKWTMYEHIFHIASDECECESSRSICLDILAKHYIHISLNMPYVDKALEIMKQRIISIIFTVFLKCIAGNSAGEWSCHLLVQVLRIIAILLHQSVESNIPSIVLEQMKQLKIMQQVVAYMNTKLVLEKLHMYLGYDLNLFSVKYFGNMMTFTTNRNVVDLKEVVDNKCICRWTMHLNDGFLRQYAQLVQIQSLLCNIVQTLYNLDISFYSNIVRHTNIVRHVFDSHFLETSYNCTLLSESYSENIIPIYTRFNHFMALLIENELKSPSNKSPKITQNETTKFKSVTSLLQEKKGDLITAIQNDLNTTSLLLSSIDYQLIYSMSNIEYLISTDKGPLHTYLSSLCRLLLLLIEFKQSGDKLLQHNCDQDIDAAKVFSFYGHLLDLYAKLRLVGVTTSDDEGHELTRIQLLMRLEAVLFVAARKISFCNQILIDFGNRGNDREQTEDRLCHVLLQESVTVLSDLSNNFDNNTSDSVISIKGYINSSLSQRPVKSASKTNKIINTDHNIIRNKLDASDSENRTNNTATFASNSALVILKGNIGRDANASKISTSTATKLRYKNRGFKLSNSLDSAQYMQNQIRVSASEAMTIRPNVYELSDVDKCRAYRALLMLQRLLSIPDLVPDSFPTLPLLLYKYLVFAKAWSLQVNQQKQVSTTHVMPLYQDLSMCVLNCLSMYLYDNMSRQVAMSRVGEKKLFNLNTSPFSGDGNVVHVLLAMLTTKGIQLSLRSVILDVISKLIHADHMSSALKNVVEVTLSQILQKSLQNTQSSVDMVLNVFYTYCQSIIAQSANYMSKMQNNASNSTNGLPTTNQTTILDLLPWMYDKYISCSPIAIAIIRFIGILATHGNNKYKYAYDEFYASSTVNILAEYDNHSLSTSSQKCLHILCDVIVRCIPVLDYLWTDIYRDNYIYDESDGLGRPHEQLMYIACVVLASILNQSEQTISLVKQSPYYASIQDICTNAQLKEIDTVGYSKVLSERTFNSMKIVIALQTLASLLL